jgi:hypothetical protein
MKTFRVGCVFKGRVNQVMDKAKFIAVLNAVNQKLGEGKGLFTYVTEYRFIETLKHVQKHVDTLQKAITNAGDSLDAIKAAIVAYKLSVKVEDAQLKQIQDDNLAAVLKSIPEFVTKALGEITSDNKNMYTKIEATMREIGGKVVSYTNGNAAKQAYVRGIGGILQGSASISRTPSSSDATSTGPTPVSSHATNSADNSSLMLACTANVVDIFSNLPADAPAYLRAMVATIQEGLKGFRVDIAAGKSPNDAMKGYSATTEKVTAGLKELEGVNKPLAETLGKVHEIAKKVTDNPVLSGDPMPESFKYMRRMGELIQEYTGDNQEYFHSIGKAMIVQDAGKVRLAINIEKLIHKLGDPPKGFSEEMITATKASLEAFKKGSGTDFNAAVEQHRKHADEMRAVLQGLPDNQLAQTILSVYVLLGSSKTSEDNPLQMFRFMTAFGAILDTYDGDHSDYIREIGQIMGYTGTKDCNTTCAIACPVITHEPFHLEWQAIHRITSILHSMQ